MNDDRKAARDSAADEVAKLFGTTRGAIIAIVVVCMMVVAGVAISVINWIVGLGS